MKEVFSILISTVRNIWFCLLALVVSLGFSSFLYSRLSSDCIDHFNCPFCDDVWIGVFVGGTFLFHLSYLLIKKLFGQKIKNWLLHVEDPAD